MIAGEGMEGEKADWETFCGLVGQANHAVCVVAIDPWAVYEHIERLDHICEIVLKSGVVDRSAARQSTSLSA